MGHYDALKYACSLVREGLTHHLEFGVAGGESIRLLRERVKGEVFGFDTFEGLPVDWLHGDKLVLPQGSFTMNGVPPEVEGCVFYKGLFRDSIPKYREVARPVGLLHVDCDLYGSARDVLDGVGDLLRDGSIIVFDEWWYRLPDGGRRCAHEKRAFEEWVAQTKRGWEFVAFRAREARIVRMLG